MKAYPERQIVFYHGNFLPNGPRLAKIKSICYERDNIFYYNGSLDDFEKGWGEKFLSLAGENGAKYLYITEYNSFGQR